jgi:hypothetical protein
LCQQERLHILVQLCDPAEADTPKPDQEIWMAAKQLKICKLMHLDQHAWKTWRPHDCHHDIEIAETAHGTTCVAHKQRKLVETK